MPPKNQRRVTAEEMIEQCRRNRRQAQMLESRSGPQMLENAVREANSRPYSTDRRSKEN